MKLTSVTALVSVDSGAGDGNQASGTEGRSAEKTGGSLLLETIRIGCGADPSDQPPENMRWMIEIALKTQLEHIVQIERWLVYLPMFDASWVGAWCLPIFVPEPALVETS